MLMFINVLTSSGAISRQQTDEDLALVVVKAPPLISRSKKNILSQNFYSVRRVISEFNGLGSRRSFQIRRKTCPPPNSQWDW
ncbi:hypothetical protein NPIL_50591 [Nephila pilipes]|uniref:Uncharacterized protein n=1 Tax=Nephila pilipes TaxID=299642 RepID=A0A8X6P7K9_NEPPI|nr:hypothetical protein NPIL_50591 [Nephila pilipes]